MNVRVMGTDVQCIWEKNCIQYIETTDNFIQLAIQKHLQQLFRISSIDLELSENNILRGVYPNILNVTDLLVEKALPPAHRLILAEEEEDEEEGPIPPIPKIKSNVLEEIIEKYRNLKSLRCHGDIDGELSPNSEIFDIEEVFFDDDYLFAPTFLESFEGRMVRLRWGEVFENDIFRFVNEWISGKKYLNLEMVGTRHSYHPIVGERTTLNDLRPMAVQWQRPNFYEYRRRSVGFDREESIRFNFVDEETLDFKRETDQKMATVAIDSMHFYFFVWN